jgi:uncharacterized protein (TIGR02996 family)
MTEAEIGLIEQQLEITVPATYRTLMLTRSDELQSTGYFDGDLSCLFLETALVIDYNQMERGDDAGTQYAFPEWWKTFFLFGTNGAGDFYVLKLDGSAEVWMIGSDCGDEPTLISNSIDVFVNELIDDYNAKKEKERLVELERARRREPFQLEVDAHREAAATAGYMPVAESWFGATNCRQLFQDLADLPFKVSPRKLRLLGIAGCKRIAACRDDAELAAALEVAERLTLGTATEAQVEATRGALRERREKASSSSGRWPVTAVHNLFQNDGDYLRGSGIYPHDPELMAVLEAVSYKLNGSPHGTIVECELFWEILGFPFLEIQFAPTWRTPAVIALASQIYATQDYSQMQQLAEALKDAGCSDSRLVNHCQRNTGHERGCWVIDLILENEPNPFEAEFTWDFECKHDKIDAQLLKEMLKGFGAASTSSSSDVAARLQFADWLQEQGDGLWADYIRVRCALDNTSPGSEYADLMEKQIECAVDMRKRVRIDFQDTYFGGAPVADEWWSNESMEYHLGLPSMVHAVSPSAKSAGPPSVLVQRIHAMMQSTPVRGVDFEEHYAEEMESILSSSYMSDLRFIDFENRSRKDSASPVISALGKASFARELEHLSIQDGIRTDDEALLLAKANFKSLRRLDMKYGKIDCSATAAEALVTASWFKQLGQLYCGIGEACAEITMRELQCMPRLHSLTLSRLPKPSVQVFHEKIAMPSLRRLAVLQTDLNGEGCNAFCNLVLPGLIGLWLENCRTRAADLDAILAAPLAYNLQALSVKESSLNESSLDVLARNPCAGRLRILQLECGDDNLKGKFQSLGSSALAGDAFPALTTLKISYPYAAKAKSDTAKMLERLVAPNLRHLTLEECDFDDQCAAALCNNPSFAKLTCLTIGQRYESVRLLSSQAAEALFRCSSLRNIIQLNFNRLELGDSISVIGDKSVLPNLKSGSFWGTKSSAATQQMIRDTRPIVYIGS